MSTPIDEKYIVFKREDFEKFVSNCVSPWRSMMNERQNDLFKEFAPEEIVDAVVIRRQDVFSAPALDGYANSIAVSLSVRNDLSSDEARNLQAIADYFHEQAACAWTTNRKLPD